MASAVRVAIGRSPKSRLWLSGGQDSLSGPSTWNQSSATPEPTNSETPPPFCRKWCRCPIKSETGSKTIDSWASSQAVISCSRGSSDAAVNVASSRPPSC